MSFEMIAWIVGTGITILGLLLLVVQFHSKQTNEFISTKYQFLKEQNEKREEEIKELRKELTNGYVRNADFNNSINQFRDDMGKLFTSVNTLSNGLHELIGEIKAGKKNGS